MLLVAVLNAKSRSLPNSQGAAACVPPEGRLSASSDPGDRGQGHVQKSFTGLVRAPSRSDTARTERRSPHRTECGNEGGEGGDEGGSEWLSSVLASNLAVTRCAPVESPTKQPEVTLAVSHWPGHGSGFQVSRGGEAPEV